MNYLLDTNICIFALKGDPKVVAALMQRSPGRLAVCSITLAELWFGARKSRQPEKTRQFQDEFLAPYRVLDFDKAAAAEYARIRFDLETLGNPIGERDQFIASIARSQNYTVVTNNLREFSRVPKLNVEDWSKSP